MNQSFIVGFIKRGEECLSNKQAALSGSTVSSIRKILTNLAVKSRLAAAAYTPPMILGATVPALAYGVPKTVSALEHFNDPGQVYPNLVQMKADLGQVQQKLTGESPSGATDPHNIFSKLNDTRETLSDTFNNPWIKYPTYAALAAIPAAWAYDAYLGGKSKKEDTRGNAVLDQLSKQLK